jgi:NAD(P)-dependent dehydrogenase (short-subunit alcohol dehydrogenase family)
MRELENKVALVTGAGRGLGAAICDQLAEAGAAVIAADVQPEAGERTADGLRQRHPAKAAGMMLDVSDARAAEAAVRQVVAQFGRLDVLVNNAGVDRTVPIEELSIEDWDRVLGVNLRGPFLLSKAAFPLMKRQAGGHIVNIVSTASKRAWANAAAYHASKWGLLGLSHALHVEGRASGVKVTAVVAGGMRTAFLLDRFPDLDPARLQDPKNVAATVRFILGQPAETVIPEVTVLPMQESSWP